MVLYLLRAEGHMLACYATKTVDYLKNAPTYQRTFLPKIAATRKSIKNKKRQPVNANRIF